MQHIKLFFIALLLSGSAAAQYQPNVDFIVLTTPQPTRTDEGKIEVIEFFNYSCPHCFRFQPHIRQWQKAQEQFGDVTLIEQPVVFQRFQGHFARVHYTLESLGLLHDTAPKVYRALHQERQLINTKSRFLDWVEETLGIERARAEAIYHSYTVHNKVLLTEKITADYGVQSTPQVAVAGKYVVNAALARGFERMIDILNYLVEQERQNNNDGDGNV